MDASAWCLLYHICGFMNTLYIQYSFGDELDINLSITPIHYMDWWNLMPFHHSSNGWGIKTGYDNLHKMLNPIFWGKCHQGPVVQSVVSLTSSLRVISLTVLADSIYNILIFFAEKMWVAFALQKLLTFFQQKISAYLRITRCKF